MIYFVQDVAKAKQTQRLLTFCLPQISTSSKGQVEITLQLCDTLQLPATESVETPEADSASLYSRNDSIGGTRRRFSFNDMKRMVKIKKKDKSPKGVTFKLTVSRMRASIKVKEEIESVAGEWRLMGF
jgi:hypothetical protein